MVFPTITPSTPEAQIASEIPRTWDSESSSGETLTIIAGPGWVGDGLVVVVVVVVVVERAALTTAERISVRGLDSWRVRRPGVLGLELLRERGKMVEMMRGGRLSD